MKLSKCVVRIFVMISCSVSSAKAEANDGSFISVGKSITEITSKVFDESLSSAINFSQSLLLSADKYLEDLPPSEEKLQTITRDQLSQLSDSAVDLIFFRDKEKSTSSFTILGKSKKDYRTDAENVLQGVLEIVLAGDLSYDYSVVRAADLKTKTIKDEIAALSEQKYFAPMESPFTKKSKQQIGDEIKLLKLEIKDLEKFIVERQNQLKISLWKIGVKLDDDQIVALTTRADSDELFQIFIVFDVAKEIAKTLEELLAETDVQKSTVQVKYYGSYVILAELVVFAQDLYIDRVNQKYLPALRLIRLDTLENIEFAEEKMRVSTSNKNVFKSNIEANRLALEVINLYEKLLLEQISKTQKARQSALEQVDVAYSSYDTAATTQNILNLINEDQIAFDKMISLQTPVIVPMDNSELSEKFAEISARLR